MLPSKTRSVRKGKGEICLSASLFDTLLEDPQMFNQSTSPNQLFIYRFNPGSQDLFSLDLPRIMKTLKYMQNREELGGQILDTRSLVSMQVISVNDSSNERWKNRVDTYAKYSNKFKHNIPLIGYYERQSDGGMTRTLYMASLPFIKEELFDSQNRVIDLIQNWYMFKYNRGLSTLSSVKSVEELLESGSELLLSDLDCIVKLFSDLANGLSELHAQGLTHNSILPRNITMLHTKDGIEFVTTVPSFGLDNNVDGVNDDHVSYFSPQVFSNFEEGVGEVFTTQNDIHMLGTLMMRILLGEEFDAKQIDSDYWEAEIGDFKKSITARLGKIALSDIEILTDLACRCISPSEDLRPTIVEIVEILAPLVVKSYGAVSIKSRSSSLSALQREERAEEYSEEEADDEYNEEEFADDFDMKEEAALPEESILQSSFAEPNIAFEQEESMISPPMKKQSLPPPMSSSIVPPSPQKQEISSSKTQVSRKAKTLSRSSSSSNNAPPPPPSSQATQSFVLSSSSRRDTPQPPGSVISMASPMVASSSIFSDSASTFEGQIFSPKPNRLAMSEVYVEEEKSVQQSEKSRKRTAFSEKKKDKEKKETKMSDEFSGGKNLKKGSPMEKDYDDSDDIPAYRSEQLESPQIYRDEMMHESEVDRYKGKSKKKKSFSLSWSFLSFFNFLGRIFGVGGGGASAKPSDPSFLFNEVPHTEVQTAVRTPVKPQETPLVLVLDEDSLQKKERYLVQKRLSDGASAIILQVKDKETGNIHVMKRFREGVESDYNREVKCLKLFSHKNIVQFVDNFSYIETMDEKSVKSNVVIMEYCNFGDLFKISMSFTTGKPKPMRPLRMLKFTLQLFEAIAHIHEFGYVHSDIKPQNIFIAKDGTLKLGDFGFTVKESETVAGGTLHYLPPEQEEGQPSVLSSDLYSAACSMFEVLVKKKVSLKSKQGAPISFEEVWDQHNKNNIHFHRKKYNPHATGLFEIFKNCLETDHKKRKPAKEIVETLRGLLQNHSATMVQKRYRGYQVRKTHKK